MFRAKKLMNIIDGTSPQELHNDEDEWADKDVCQSIIISVVDPKLMCRLMTCRTSNHMWRRLSPIHEQNAIENIQLLQHQFYELRIKPNVHVVDHISTVEQLVNQLIGLR